MMRRKKVVFVADSLDNAHKFKTLLSKMDTEVYTGSSLKLRSLILEHQDCDLVVFEVRNGSLDVLASVEDLLVDATQASLLIIVDERVVADFRMPMRVKSDFVVRNASIEECGVRVRHLLWPGNESAVSDCITVEDMTINLSTYQVKINGEPIDFTYLEYALLAFLVTHPGKTYSRDVLLSRVWGFDYYGGTRTVDVHVRRVRAKLGPELAQHLETVRGVGYLWTV